jgi:hypothetical protein
MKRLATKTLVGAAALATLIAAPALAQPLYGSAAPGPYGHDWQVPRDPYAVVVRARVKGRDPDPFIRWAIYRGYWVDNSVD